MPQHTWPGAGKTIGHGGASWSSAAAAAAAVIWDPFGRDIQTQHQIPFTERLL